MVEIEERKEKRGSRKETGTEGIKEGERKK